MKAFYWFVGLLLMLCFLTGAVFNPLVREAVAMMVAVISLPLVFWGLYRLDAFVRGYSSNMLKAGHDSEVTWNTWDPRADLANLWQSLKGLCSKAEPGEVEI